MKRVLSFLLMVVFTFAQTSPLMAISGGPEIGLNSSVSTVGTFAGVLVPEESTNPSATASTGASANSIGVFSLGVPDVGIAQGALVIFVDGNAFNGNITGVADPLNGNLRGIIDAVSTATFVDPADPDNELSVFAQGNLEAEIRDTVQASSASATSFLAFSYATTRIEGTAQVDVFGDLNADGTPKASNTVTFSVDGFKQSLSVNTTTDLSVTPGT